MIHLPRATVLLALLVVFAPAAPAAAPVTAPAAVTGELASALERVRADHIRADVEFLACDDLRGRNTPSRELRAAARYLRARVQRLGFQPGGDGGSFLHRYPLVQWRAVPAECSARVEGQGLEAFDLAFGEDYLFRRTGDLFPSEMEAELLWVGDGQRADFASPLVHGRWAVCRGGEVAPLRLKRYAERAGAAGLVVLAPREGPALDGKWERIRERLLDGPAAWPKEGADRSGGLPEIFLSPQASRRFEALVAAGRLDGAAASRPTLRERRVVAREREVENVCALWPGSDPVLSKEVILLSAHYDHVGARGDEVYNGADDNASGTSTLLAVADALAVRGPLERSVLIVWVSGEEKGLWGSKAWAARPSLPAGMRAVCDINMDMLGRNAPDELYVTPSAGHSAYNGLVKLFERLAPLEGFPELGSADKYYKRSDHYEFAKLGIPVAFLFAGEHEDYHRPSDTADKIDTDKIRRAARLLLRVLEELQAPVLDL